MEEKSLKVKLKTWKRIMMIKLNRGLKSVDVLINRALDKFEDDGDGRR